MALRILTLLLPVLLIAAPVSARQGQTPRLNRNQRDTLQSAVSAVDAAAALPETPGIAWQTHVLRASDGSHYVAFSMLPPAQMAPRGPSTLYVRLATRPGPSTTLAERSTVMEWLKGIRSDPLVAKKQRGIAFGEMPMYGPGAIAARGPGTQSTDLALLGMERERARERKEAADRERKAALEGTALRARDAVFPFEDFAIDQPLASNAEDAFVLRRSLTAGPGEYELYVAWAAADRKTPVRVVKRTLSLAPASTSELSVSTVILADQIQTRESPYPADQQASHPYAIGAMEIVPAQDDVFTNDERLAVVFQVMNAQPAATGKPDVSIGFQLFRVSPDGDQSVGMLNPQHYNESTLPADFDLTEGHPLFAALAAPLRTLARGDYRLRITVVDKLAGRSTPADATFTLVGTPATLLAAAPFGAHLRREALLDPAVLSEVATRLETNGPTPALTALREGRFVELLRDDPGDPPSRPLDPAGFGVASTREQGLRNTLRGIGLYALGDPRMAGTLLRQAVPPNPAALLFEGAVRALEGNDRDAVTAWQAALDAGFPEAIVAPFLIDAHLRLGDPARAGMIARTALASGSTSPAAVRGLATWHLTERRHDEAAALLDRYLSQHGDDLDVQFLLMHTLFAGFVSRQGSAASRQPSVAGHQPSTPPGNERFETLARGYIDAKGRHAALVAEWTGLMK